MRAHNDDENCGTTKTGVLTVEIREGIEIVPNQVIGMSMPEQNSFMQEQQ
jgi:hypothetical protein